MGSWGPKAGTSPDQGSKMLKIVTAKVPQAGHSVREKTNVPDRPGGSTALVRTSTKMPRDGAGRDSLEAAVPLGKRCLELSGMDSFLDAHCISQHSCPGGMQGTVEIDASCLQREPCFGQATTCLP